MKKKKVFGLFLVTIMGLAVFLTGCSETNQAPDDKITIVSYVESDSLNPVSGLTTDRLQITQIFDTLVKYNPDHTIAPNLAESWTESDDKMSVILKIRDDVTFHDGSKMTAEDVLFSFEKLLETPFGAGYKDYITNVEMIDDYTIKVTKTASYQDVLTVLAEIPQIVPQSVLEADEKKFGEQPVGSGAYKFIKKDRDGSIVLEANDEYFLGAPQIKNVVVKPPIDYATSVVALENGDVDMVVYVPSNLHDQISRNSRLEIAKEAGWSQRMMIFPGEPFASNMKLREAVYHAINPESVFVMGANKDGIIAQDLFAQKTMGDYSGSIDLGERYDPELAKQLLKESGYDVSKFITFDADPVTIDVLQVIQADLKAIGLNIEIQQVDFNTLFSKLLKGELPVMIQDFGISMITMEDMLNSFTTDGDPNKMFGPKDSDYDALMEKVLVESDSNVRATLVQQAYEQLINRTAAVPFYQTNFNIAYSSNIENVHGMATYTIYIKDLKFK